ncbi:heptaprenyl diphosphate synthase [Acetivibrio ethanolgignens]|uniref:Heptaprenyl diphosphate synthase n=1 Tax=Acetivibrio ethanolgignens TaxID=290052 RepID=A0A0V8QC65_9FIRM|nr:Gx transporter family protein [Acetivibrio ethanolgignens]KSV57846.1 heptaprenyl diphosphate synthase [Acetivibrio ethanolgignens]
MEVKKVAKKVAVSGVLIALAFIFSYVEVLLPFQLGIPGVKLGLANIVSLVALYLLDEKMAATITVVRVILTGFTFGSLYSMLYSMAGALLSLAFMIGAKRWNKFTMIGVSVLGGVMHNAGQLIMAAVVLKTVPFFYYTPVLILSGIVTGIMIGFLGKGIRERLVKLEA